MVLIGCQARAGSGIGLPVPAKVSCRHIGLGKGPG